MGLLKDITVPPTFSRLAVIRTRREMWIKVMIATFGIVVVTDAVDALVNLYTQPDRLWPSFIQTTLIAALMSLLFLGLLAQANLRLFQLKERFEALAHTDLQTGLMNRRGFFAALDRAKASGDDLTLGVLDIDHFKRINDAYGHLVGDYVIAEVGRVLQQEVSPPHLVGRVGGEEFAIALNGMNPLAALGTGDLLRRSLSRVGGEPLPSGMKVTASIGLAHVGGGDVLEAYRRADQALYEAKHQGRNRTVSADMEVTGNVITLPITIGS